MAAMQPLSVPAAYRLIVQAQRRLQEMYKPDGFTIGVNDGKAAGRSIDPITSISTSSRDTWETPRVQEGALGRSFPTVIPPHGSLWISWAGRPAVGLGHEPVLSAAERA